MSSSPILADSLPVPAASSRSHGIPLQPHHPSPMDAAVPRSVYNPPHPPDARRFQIGESDSKPVPSRFWEVCNLPPPPPGPRATATLPRTGAHCPIRPPTAASVFRPVFRRLLGRLLGPSSAENSITTNGFLMVLKSALAAFGPIWAPKRTPKLAHNQIFGQTSTPKRLQISMRFLDARLTAHETALC